MASRALYATACAVSIAGLGAALAFAWWSDHERRDAPPPPTTATATAVAIPQVFARAQLGDWNAFTFTSKSSLAHTHATVISTITAITATAVTRVPVGRDDGNGEVHPDAPDDFPRAGLTLDELEQTTISSWTLDHVTTKPAPYAIGDRTFACTQLDFDEHDPMLPTKLAHQTLWISDDVPAGGLVASHEVQDVGGLHFDLDHELVGFGTAAATTWGTKPALAK